LLGEAFAQWERGKLLAALDAAGVPAAPINSVPEVFADPQIVHRQMLRRIPHPLSGEVPQVVSPINFLDAPLSFDRAPPLLGADTAAVLAEIGIDTGERDRLAAAEVI
jgi:crotonobetainyl-CoA:carnitine CoA-transferase CaiB-like acyl-CoA transferase